MTNFIEVKEKVLIQKVVELASVTWKHHYIPIIGNQQVVYMLKNFQSSEAIEKQITDGRKYYLIEQEELAIGYLAFDINENHLFLSKLYILSFQQGKGLGKAAIEFLKLKLKECNLDKIALQVNKNNKNTITFYEKQSFKKVKPIVVDIGNGFVMDDYWMELIL